MTATDNILALEEISKSFYGARVLYGISLTVRRGEILGLVGENGAGKSTLMNILGGVLPKDTGRMELAGQPYSPESPRDAQDAGIAFIHQELNLFSNLTVAENIFVDTLPTGPLWSVRHKDIKAKAQEYINRFGVQASPTEKVSSLPMGVRQTIEITKALITRAKIIIFDEPTTSLSQKEKSNLFDIIHQLKDAGVTIIYISHILEDVFFLCDRIAVLRDGKLIGVDEVSNLNRIQVIKMMVGRELNQVYPSVEKTIGPVVYEARRIRRGRMVQDVSFNIRSGEIVGLFGLMGAGRTELMRCLFGVDRMEAGEVHFMGKRLKNLSPETCIRNGMAFVTEDRRQEGLLMSKPLKDNLVLAKLRQLLKRFGLVDSKLEDKEAARAIEQLDVKAQNKNTQMVGSLSGGNQQKVVLGKWLINSPALFFMDEPTRGVDVAAKYEIYITINQMAKNGKAILFVSSEMEELMGTCDRIMVMRQGRLVGDIPRQDFNQEKIISYALDGAGSK